jgi:hypothetical protein
MENNSLEKQGYVKFYWNEINNVEVIKCKKYKDNSHRTEAE